MSVSEPVCVVGVGASAGGLEALKRLLRAFSRSTPVCFLVVQHQSPGFKSLMDELLSRETELAVRQATDGVTLEAGSVYLVRPGMRPVVDEHFVLTCEPLPDTEPPGRLRQIDEMLSGLSRSLGERAVAIVLSGTGTDGTAGTAAVHASGGLVLAQDPETAQFDGMPGSVIDSGCAHLVLAPEDMQAPLLRYASGHGPFADRDAPDDEDAVHVARLVGLLQQRTGVDVSNYKLPTVLRRVHRRLSVGEGTDLASYVERLASDTEELDSLWHDLLIGVTVFFRDPEAFERIAEHLDALVEQLSPERDLRLWVPGCATGEEAYSLAMLAMEAFRARAEVPRLKVFASDIDHTALEVASKGRYPAKGVELVPAELRRRYFEPVQDDFRVASDVRSCMVFTQHNVLQDAPFTRIDLISCRNLLIYFEPAAQRRVLSLFHFALQAHGVLFLGPSESLGHLADAFETVDRRWRVFRKQERPRVGRLPRLNTAPTVRRIEEPSVRETAVQQGRAHLMSYGPPSLLVSDDLRLLHIFNGAGRYLDQSDGTPTLSLLDMLSGEARFAVAGAVKRALRERGEARYDRIRLGVEAEDDRAVSFTVTPLDDVRGQGIALIQLEEEASRPRVDSGGTVDELARERVVELEAELERARESLRAALEELESGNEELQATNEELTASNEELQSTNEELHSLNEELYSVNSEYQAKIAELTELTNDMDHLLEATQVHLVFLDADLRIRRFTPRMADTFHLLEGDVGRPIAGFAHRLETETLLDDLERVRDTGETLEREVASTDGALFLMRVLPYQPEGRIDGVVLTLIDIGALRESQRRYAERDAQLLSLLEHSPVPIYFKDPEGRFLYASRSTTDLMGLDPVGKRLDELVEAEVAAHLEEGDAVALERRMPVEIEERFPAPDGRERVFRSAKFPVFDDGRLRGIAGVSVDVTDHILTLERDREAVEARDRFLAMLSHELRNPLGAILGASAALELDDDARRQEAEGVIRRQGRHMARLLDDLLDVGRISSGRLTLHAEPVEFVAAVRQLVRDQPDPDRIRLSCPDEACWVSGDADRLAQVVNNLLSNALKYSPDGAPVHVDLVCEKDELVLTVRDGGIGMTEEQRRHVFELFYQAPQGIDRSDGGMGVGLSLVRELIRLHAGAIDVASDGPGEGSTFTVRLPRLQDHTPTAALRKTPRPTSPLSVLLVDDNRDAVQMLALLLRASGHTVTTAYDGREAIERLSDDEDIDVAFVDIGLPDLDGYEVARTVREELRRDLMLVALTGYGQAEDRARAFDAGFDEHLTKPLDPDRLDGLLADASAHATR